MTRQILVAATMVDEAALLSFAAKRCTVRVLLESAASPEALWLTDGVPPLAVASYFICNDDLVWQPRLVQVADGVWQVDNRAVGPLVQVVRAEVPGGRGGRLQWSAEGVAGKGLAFDAGTFHEWLERIARWVRTTSKKDGTDPYSPLYLPDAWRQHREQLI